MNLDVSTWIYNVIRIYSVSHTIATTKLGKDAIEAQEALDYVKQILKEDVAQEDEPVSNLQ